MADHDRRDIRARLLVTFRAEAEEHLQAITTSLAALEHGLTAAEAAATVESTFREVHTLKGAARSVSLTDVEAICQACESVLSRMTRGEVAIARAVLTQLGEAMGAVARLLGGEGSRVAVREIVERLEQSLTEPPGERPAALPVTSAPGDAVAGPPADALPRIDTIRIATARLDALAVHAEELLSPKLAAAARVDEARALAEEVSHCRAALGRARSEIMGGLPKPPKPPALGAVPGGARTHPGNPGRPSGPDPFTPSDQFAVDGARRDAVGTVDAELRRLEGRVHEMLAHLVRDQRAVATTVDALHDELRRLRMTPASTVLDVFPAMVRDLAREASKDVEWVGRGGELDVDRKVLQAMKEPLIHLVRNAIDHGIEPPAARAEAGKPARGRVSVTMAPAEGNRVEVLVEDDGRGIDAARLRAEAVRSRLLPSETAHALTDEETLALAFRSGLSTSAIITDLSGHGLGLAIVKERVERLGGTIELATRPGAGTTVRMLVPTSVATLRGLLVASGDQAFLVPLDAVERVIRVAASDVEHLDGRPTIRLHRGPRNGPSNPPALGAVPGDPGRPSMTGSAHGLRQGGPLAVAPLSEILGLAPSGDADGGVRRPCVVMRTGAERAGILVDDVLGDREVQVKELRRPLVRVRNVAGAGLLGTGRPVLILRPEDLLRSMREAPRPAAPAARPRAGRQNVVLVVDDSITTRTMEKNLLEAAGFQVRVAVDGIEAWTVLKTETVDLVVSDVDMPRMNGFELTARIRADRALADLPVVLVTALESREDKERGVDVGASAYLVKSTFDQSNLLEIIRRLV